MIDLDAATINELRVYARDELGLQVPQKGMTKELLIEAIRDADPSFNPEPVKAGEDLPAPAVKGKKTVKIMVHKTSEQGGDRDVFVGVNGKARLIKRGVEVEVPIEVAEVLKNAIETRYEWKADPRHPQGGENVARDAQAYPFSVIG